jgi:hypothetical protein
MDRIFYMHLVASILNVIFIVFNWLYCRKIINISYKEIRSRWVAACAISHEISELELRVSKLENITKKDE